jgi:hypothetical protein
MSSGRSPTISRCAWEGAWATRVLSFI